MSLMPDVAFLLFDSDLGAQPFTVKRRKGKWNSGRFDVSEEKILDPAPVGIMLPPTEEQMLTLPEGVRRNGIVALYTTTMLHVTEGEDIADDVTWLGEQYKIIRVDRWDQYGFWIAFAHKR